MPDNLFSYLVIGLAKLVEDKPYYPYPDEFQYSLNVLAGAMLSSYPKTLAGLFKLFSRPLQEWWPAEMPTGFDPAAALIYDQDLSEEATEFLEQFFDETRLPRRASLGTIQIALDNQRIKRLLKVLQDAYEQDRVGAQQTYIAVRRFLIEHPWTTAMVIGDALGDLPYIKISDIGDLYIDAADLSQHLLHPHHRDKSAYWNCPHCGPLRVKHKQLGPIKPSVCGQHCPGPNGWQAISPERGLRILRKGIHLRTHIPGILEVKLFDWLAEQKQAHPDQLIEVQLWPGIDRYDLQLRFKDEVWGIDVKDYKDPYRLGQKIKNDKLYNLGSLGWDQGFYVFPTYRQQQHANYQACVIREATPLPQNIRVISDKKFRELVTKKLKQRGED